LHTIVTDEIDSSTPLALCSVPGLDASNKVENMAADLQTPLVSVAMGSAECYGLADTAVNTGVRSGNWVLLKNVHLTPQWLGQLEKRLHSLKAHRSFRLFLTMEINPKVPVNLLRLSRIIMFEPAAGIKASLLDSLTSIPKQRLNQAPVERSRLYFLISWLHAVVVERLRYSPLGWTKTYEFNDSDQDCAMETIDTWIDEAAGGRSNLSPEKIPWTAIKTLLKESIYGGRVDNEFDQRLLDAFVETLFSARSYDVGFCLVDGVDSTQIPEGTRVDQFLTWVNGLPDKQSPVWLGLPADAEKLLLISKGMVAPSSSFLPP
jgi:dynein heavy chain 1